ncbi:MAG: DUF5011 domain-containing protein [Candidatus Hydrogenedens sp.]|nr:DUF5011 domain-containing protein [Candidatus Hydrogenedens sp.]
MQRFLVSSVVTFALCIAPLTPSYSQTQNPVIHEANTNPLGIHLSRQVPREYTPGSPLEIVLTIYCDAPDPNYPVTAVGLYESIPAEWTFTSMRGVTTEPPPIAPSPGTQGTLQFAWITPPNFPCTFAYTVQVPENMAGVKTFSGQVEYRTNGPRLVSPPEITQINGIDRIPPEITLLGDNPMTIYQGSDYIEPGWKAKDNADGDVTDRVQVSGNVNVNQPGEYTLTYTVRDNAGNNASASRVVRVLEKNVTPTSATGTVPISPGPAVLPPPVTTTRPTRPAQTAMKQPTTSSTSATSPTSIPSTSTPRPEEVTFPRPDMHMPPNIPNIPNIPKDAKPQGIASGQPLKPFDLPKEIKGGLRPPPSHEGNRTLYERTKQSGQTVVQQITPPSTTKTNVAKTTEVTETTPAITPKPPVEPLQESKKQEEVMSPAEKRVEPSTTSLATAENTKPLEPASIDTGGKPGLPSYLAQLKNWWAERTQAERRNLMGMFILFGLLTLLCVITGRTAYQGITPQPRKKVANTISGDTSEK